MTRRRQRDRKSSEYQTRLAATNTGKISQRDQLTLFEPRCRRCGEPCVSPVCSVCIETLRSWSAWGEEYWLPVPGVDGYEVSNLGRVRNGRKDRMLAPHPDRHGYPYVRLPGHAHALVHSLVLRSFVGPRPDRMECCHYDDVRDHNRLFNLRWDTAAANRRDAVRNRHRRAPKTCSRCAAVFVPIRATAKFCSGNCRKAAFRERREAA
jgi:hypothetical protein